MPRLFDYAWAANRVLGASPEAFALLKRVYDRIKGAPDVELARIIASKPLQPAPAEPSRGRVLFFSPRYWPVHASWQLVVAHALRAEGYEPSFVGCGAAARICDMYAVEMPQGGFCKYCDRSLERLVRAGGMSYRELGDFIDADAVRAEARARVADLDLAQCRDFEDGGMPIGRLVEPSVARSLRQVMFEPDALTLRLYRGFIETALVNRRALERILEEDWSLTFMLNGKFLAESILYHLAAERGLDRITYERGFRTNTLFFAVNDQVTDFDISRHYERIKDTPLSDAQERRLRVYEGNRRGGKEMIISYFPEIEEDAKAIVAEHGIDTGKKVAVAYPNIVWDTAVFGHERAFTSIWDWVRTTVEAYRELPDWELIVRIHPAEIRLPARTRESMLTLIEQHFGRVPDNVHLIPPTSKASSYVFMELAQRVLVYSSTMGLEAAMQGKEVITTAKTHYAELGFTRDAHDPEGYRSLLASPLQDDGERVRALARRYANLFFYRFHVPVGSLLEPELSHADYRFRDLEDLLAGGYPEVEFVRRVLTRLEPGCQILPPDQTPEA